MELGVYYRVWNYKIYEQLVMDLLDRQLLGDQPSTDHCALVRRGTGGSTERSV